MKFEITGVNGSKKVVNADALKVMPEGIVLADADGKVTGWINPGAVAFVVDAQESQIVVVK